MTPGSGYSTGICTGMCQSGFKLAITDAYAKHGCCVYTAFIQSGKTVIFAHAAVPKDILGAIGYNIAYKHSSVLLLSRLLMNLFSY